MVGGMLLGCWAACGAQAPAAAKPGGAGCDLVGAVVDSHGSPVGEAAVTMRGPADGSSMDLVTDRAGSFRAAALPCGRYELGAQKGALRSQTAAVTLAPNVRGETRLVLGADGSISPQQAARPSQAIEFSDKPNFAVAGVTDWTAVGGHGSDTVLRTSEDLSRETARLGVADVYGDTKDKSSGGPGNAKTAGTTGAEEARLRAAVAAAPGSYAANRDLGEFYLHAGRAAAAVPALRTAASLPQATATDQYNLALACEGVGDYTEAQRHVQAAVAGQDAAQFHALAGALAEKLGDPLAAVEQLQRAAQLDPSEANYLAWGSELLVHRAIWQAAEVFDNGANRHPASARLKSAWGAALFAEARYDEAARQLCDASALDPASTEPYLFLGKMTLTSAPLVPCEVEALARFVQQQPARADANFFYAMALLRQGGTPDAERAEGLLRKTVALDPSYAAAFLQLGILASNRKMYLEAVRDFEQAVNADPQEAEAHYRLGVAYDRTGDKAHAREQLQLHDELRRAQAEAVEQQRKEVKQFSVAAGGNVTTPTAQP